MKFARAATTDQGHEFTVELFPPGAPDETHRCPDCGAELDAGMMHAHFRFGPEPPERAYEGIVDKAAKVDVKPGPKITKSAYLDGIVEEIKRVCEPLEAAPVEKALPVQGSTFGAKGPAAKRSAKKGRARKAAARKR